MKSVNIFVYILITNIYILTAAIVKLSIKCISNCPPAPVMIDQLLTLQVLCESSESECSKIKSEWYEWSFSPELNYERDLLHGRNNDQVIVKNDVLDPGKSYEVTVRITESAFKGSKAIYRFKTYDNSYNGPKLQEACRLIPKKGKCLTTMFKANCGFKSEKSKMLFSIYVIRTYKDVLIKDGIVLENIKFPICPPDDIRITAFDKHFWYVEDTIHINPDYEIEKFIPDDVRASPSKLDNFIQKNFFTYDSTYSLQKMLDNQQYTTFTETLAMVMGFFDEKDRNANVTYKYFDQFLDLLDKVPKNDIIVMKRIISLINRDFKSVKERGKASPDYIYKTSLMCKRIGNSLSNILLEGNDTFRTGIDTRFVIDELNTCSQETLNANEMNKNDQPFPIEITTEQFEPVSEIVLEENYPDYVDDYQSLKIAAEYHRCLDNLIDLCYSTCKSWDLFMRNKKSTRSILSRKFRINILKQDGYVTSQSKMISHDVVLRPSKDFENTNEMINTWFCTFTGKMANWFDNSDYEKITSTAIVYVHNNNYDVIKKFTKPVSITFQLEDRQIRIANLTRGQAESSKNLDNITLYRIDARTSKPIVVEWLDLKDSDNLEIRLFDFKKPSPEDMTLTNTVNISTKNEYLIWNNDHAYDSFQYLAIFSTKGKVHFKFQANTFECFFWNREAEKWEYSEQPVTVKYRNNMTCKLFHLTAVRGKADYTIKTKKEPTTIKIEVELKKPPPCYIIIACLSIVWCLYFVLVIVYTVKREYVKIVWYLSDVFMHARYLYVIAIKTGNRLFAGTTSNILITLNGTVGKSDEHLLNYPDPDLKLLQRNEEDWFALGTEQYLGDLESIQLRIDLLGGRPSWYCQDVKIFDTVGKSHWTFTVGKWFDALNTTELTETLDPTISVKRKSIFHAILNEPNFWNFSVRLPWLSKIKRINLCLSVTLTIFFSNIICYGLPQFDESDSLELSAEFYITRYEIYLYGLYSSVLSFILHIFFILFFRIINRPSVIYKKLITSNTTIIEYVLWFIIITNILILSSFITIYGFAVPYITSLYWMASSITGLIIYTFIFENILRFISPFICSGKVETEAYFEFIRARMSIIEIQRSFLYQVFGKFIIRPYIDHIYKQPTKEQIHLAKKKHNHKARLLEMFEDIIIFLIFIVLLYVVIIYNTETLIYHNNKQVKDLIKQIHNKSVPRSFDNIYTKQDIINFINHSLLTTVQGNRWYGRYYTSNPSVTSDFHKKTLGVLRLRQHRTKKECCNVNEEMSFLKMDCLPTYSSCPNYDVYGRRWETLKHFEKLSTYAKTWVYTLLEENGPRACTGTFDIYPSGGYISKLGRTQINSQRILYYLAHNRWLDNATRSLLIEFLLYNANNNLFDSVVILFETTALGYIEKSVQVDTRELLIDKKELLKFLLSCILIFVMFLIIFKIIRRFIRSGKLLFTDYWNLFDFFIVLLIFSIVAVYTVEDNMVNNFMETLKESKRNEFIEYFKMFDYNYVIILVTAILIFAKTIRIWKLLRIIKIFRIMETTLIFSFKYLVTLLIFKLIILIMFTLIGYILYSEKSKNFPRLSDSFITYLLFSIKIHKHIDHDLFTSILDYILQTIFILFTLVILSLLIAILCSNYAKAQHYHSDETFNYSVKDYIVEQFLFMCALLRLHFMFPKHKADVDKYGTKIENIQSKKRQFRYANNFSIVPNRMAGMICATQSVIRNFNGKNKNKLNDKDFRLMLKTVSKLLHGEKRFDIEKEIFFMTREIHGKSDMTLVEDKRIQRMETLTRYLLNTDEFKDRQQFLYKKILNAHIEKMAFLSNYLDNMNKVVDNIRL